jgi:hypothetical protein
MHPSNKLNNLRRRVNRVRKHTCPASRHLYLMADVLITYGRCRHIEQDPHYCAATMLAVLESLWKARIQLEKRRAKSPHSSARG